MLYTFDPEARTIEPDAISSTITVNTNDIYSRWKEWAQVGINAGFGEVFIGLGGEPIGSGLSAGFYLFLSQGWTIHFPAGIGRVVVEGNLVRDPDDNSGAALFTAVDTVQIEQQVSAVALGYSTGGGTFTSSDRTLLQSASTNTTTLLSRLTDLRATALDSIAAILAKTTSALRLMVADEAITPTRYRKIDRDNGTAIILEKTVTNDGDGSITLTDEGDYQP